MSSFDNLFLTVTLCVLIEPYVQAAKVSTDNSIIEYNVNKYTQLIFKNVSLINYEAAIETQRFQLSSRLCVHTLYIV